MARRWWTTYPDQYFMKNTAKGGRNVIAFALLGKVSI